MEKTVRKKKRLNNLDESESNSYLDDKKLKFQSQIASLQIYKIQDDFIHPEYVKPKINSLIDKMSPDLIDDFTRFLGIEDTLRFMFVNKRTKGLVEKRSYLFFKFISLLRLLRSKNILPLSLLYEETVILEREYNEILNDGLIKYEVDEFFSQFISIRSEYSIINLKLGYKKFYYLLINCKKIKIEGIEVDYYQIYQEELKSLIINLIKKHPVKKLFFAKMMFSLNDFQTIFEAIRESSMLLEELTIDLFDSYSSFSPDQHKVNILLNNKQFENTLINIKGLKKLFISFNENFKEQLINYLSFNKSLKHLKLYTDIEKYDFIRVNENLEILEFNPWVLTQKGMRSLSQALNKNFSKKNKKIPNISNLNTLILNGHQSASPKMAEYIADFIIGNHNLKILIINNFNLRNDSGNCIYEALKRNYSLTHLNLFGNFIDNKGFFSLLSALKINKVLETIDLSSNCIDVNEDRENEIIEILESNNVLMNLNLGNNITSIKHTVQKYFIKKNSEKNNLNY
jgi:hypothetical protein